MQTQSIEAVVFTYIVRQRFVQQPGKFDKYTKILRDLCSKTGDSSHGISELKKMFADHQDLLIGLNNFLPRNKTPVLNFHKPLKFTIEFVNKVHKRLANNNNNNNNNNDQVFIKFCDIMCMYRNKQVTIDEVDRLLTDLFRNDPDLYVEFTRFMVDESEDTEDLEYNPAGKFVFTGGNRGRTRREDLYEETLVIWETYKYELDMLHLRMQSTAQKLTRLKMDLIKIEEFQIQDFKCIEVLYGGRADEEDGEAMVQQLLSDPAGNAETMMARMMNKCEEIEERKILMDRVWGEILEDIRERRKEVRHSCFLEKVRREFLINKT